MELYFSPLACSLATRAALYELAVDAKFIEVDPKTKHTKDGADFRAIHALGLVPVLRTDDGQLLFESAAVLQFVAARSGDTLANEAERTRLQQWLSFIGTELHKATFVPLLSDKASQGAKAYALEHAAERLGFVEAHLAGREYLLDRFSVADLYLATVLNWTAATPVKLDAFPNLRAFHERIRARPGFARAFAEELELYRAQQAKSR